VRSAKNWNSGFPQSSAPISPLIRATALAPVPRGNRPGWVVPQFRRSPAEWLESAQLGRCRAPPGAAPAGCADTSLYRRFHAAGLTRLSCFAQFAVLAADEASRITVIKQRILAALTPDEAAEWQSAMARSEAEGTFFIATPHHCAIGAKPNTQT
jgi:hypothetical protein